MQNAERQKRFRIQVASPSIICQCIADGAQRSYQPEPAPANDCTKTVPVSQIALTSQFNTDAQRASKCDRNRHACHALLAAVKVLLNGPPVRWVACMGRQTGQNTSSQTPVQHKQHTPKIECGFNGLPRSDRAGRNERPQASAESPPRQTKCDHQPMMSRPMSERNQSIAPTAPWPCPGPAPPGE